MLSFTALASAPLSSTGGSAVVIFAPPQVPIALTTSYPSGRVFLFWNIGSIASDLQLVYRTTLPGAYGAPLATIVSGIGSQTSYDDVSITNGVTYYYQIRTYLAGVEVDRSNEAPAYPQAVPLPPSNLVGVAGNGRVFLSWTPSTTFDVVTQRLYRALAPNAYGTALVVLSDNVTGVYTDLTAQNGVPYYYIVRAMRADTSESLNSGQIGPLTPQATLALALPVGTAPAVSCGPADTTLAQLIADGMIEAGQYGVTAAQVATFQSAQFQTLKSEMWFACETDELLATEAVLIDPTGSGRLTLPCDFDQEIALWAYDGDWGIATDGNGLSTTMGLDASASYQRTLTTFDVGSGTYATSELIGLPLFLVSGNGAPQMRSIIDYDMGRRVVTVDRPWTWSPTYGTTYLIGRHARKLSRVDDRRAPMGGQWPASYARIGTTLSVYPAGERPYPIMMVYTANLTRIDEASPLFIKHLRERRALWLQGIKTKTMARWDDDRYPQEEAKWQMLLAKYAGKNTVYAQMEWSR